MRSGFLGVGRTLLLCTFIGVLSSCGATQAGEQRQLNDELALQTVRDVCQAEKTHHLIYGAYSTLGQLAGANPGTKISRLQEDGFAGHRFELRTQDEGFAILAAPIERNVTGMNDFYCDETGVTRFSTDGKRASAQSRVVESVQ